ncbi:diiron oxygenase [Pseudomonas sp. LS1212]|uniref:diiron oxygenase n=1 Tax=Pseudomonas sp. LS1212 TaxID=2972478 RepID=UPI00215BF95E|nr:diiron oxygenase [Pseudomonas sp. LS1212]UVJ43809.1 diiron oxygenase [Pseudomonas sp. LS1212]
MKTHKHNVSADQRQTLPSTLGDWDQSSSVRSRPNAYDIHALTDAEIMKKDWFPPAMLTYLQHPFFKSADPDSIRKLLASHLVYFLDYTTILEHKIVNRAVEIVVHDSLGIIPPLEMRAAGLQLYTDEGYHALFSDQLAEQVAKRYAYKRFISSPARIDAIFELINTVDAKNIDLVYFLAGFVSETIIAKELSSITNDQLVTPVYMMFRDHLYDEAKHCRYFTIVFMHFWQNMTSEQRDFTALTLPKIIKIYFKTDIPWLEKSLLIAGVPVGVTTEILGHLSDNKITSKAIQSGATSTILAIKKSGMLDSNHYRNIFIAEGIIDE